MEGSLTGEVKLHIEAMVSAAEEVARALRRDAEEEARRRLEEAEAEAESLIRRAREEAETLVIERRRRLEDLSEATIEQADRLLGELEQGRALEARLGEAANSLTSSARALEVEVTTARAPAPTAVGSPSPPSGGSVASAAGRAGRADDHAGPPGSRLPDRERVGRARLVAAEMAAAGSSRADTAAHIRRTFGLDQPEDILEVAFEALARSDRRVGAGA